LFAGLYFSEGAPIGFIWWALPTLLFAAGVPVERCTALTALLVLPWTLKFLWAPLVDRYRSDRFSWRGWIVSAQVVMAVTLAPFLLMLKSGGLAAHFDAVRLLLLAHALAAATQDVAIDGWCISQTVPEERGRINGWMQAGMLLGRSLLGGGALILAANFGLSIVILLLMLAILLPSLFLFLVSSIEVESRLEAPNDDEIPGVRHATGGEIAEGSSEDSLLEERKSVFAAIGHLLSQRRTWIGLGIALLAGSAFEGLGAVTGPLLKHVGWEKEMVGWMMAVPLVASRASTCRRRSDFSPGSCSSRP